MSYPEMVPPFELVPFEEMKKKQVEQYFNWFINTKEERIQNLQNYIQEEVRDIVLDKSPESLIYLWDWFQNRIEWEEKTKQEIEGEVQARPAWMRYHILEDPVKIPVHILILAVDISVYLGETIIHNNPSIYWGYLMGPKKLDGVKRPRLMGFQGDMTMFPYTQVEVSIWKSRDKIDKLQLYNIYNKKTKEV